MPSTSLSRGNKPLVHLVAQRRQCPVGVSAVLFHGGRQAVEGSSQVGDLLDHFLQLAGVSPGAAAAAPLRSIPGCRQPWTEAIPGPGRLPGVRALTSSKVVDCSPCNRLRLSKALLTLPETCSMLVSVSFESRRERCCSWLTRWSRAAIWTLHLIHLLRAGASQQTREKNSCKQCAYATRTHHVPPNASRHK